MSRPKNIVLLVADSLRHSNTYRDGEDGELRWASAQGTTFTQARSAGCWTLPATASMFTGLTPHEHGATSQTRSIHEHLPTLAEGMAERGYLPIQVTANVATTHIFGLHRGFEEVVRIWTEVESRELGLSAYLAIMGKPRIRKRLFSKDFIMRRLSDDLEAAKVWTQSTAEAIFDRARKLLAEHNRRGQGVFLFLNLMETHFPYHIEDVFRFLSQSILRRSREFYGMYHFANQSFLVNDKRRVSQPMLDLLRERQRLAWARAAALTDEFLREIGQGGDNAVVFCSDHGDAFGEQGWAYHFSNITDGGNHVPLVWLSERAEAGKRIDTPVSMRHLYQSLLTEAGAEGLWHLAREPERSETLLEAYWYNNRGRTLEKYRYNQFAFLDQGTKYVNRRGQWESGAIEDGGPEATWERLDGNPIEELQLGRERKERLQEAHAGFSEFEGRIRKQGQPEGE
jgi:hypothetical protein